MGDAPHSFGESGLTRHASAIADTLEVGMPHFWFHKMSYAIECLGATG
jgi:hypothetical protein